MNTVYNIAENKYGTIMEVYANVSLFKEIDGIVRLGNVDNKFVFMDCFVSNKGCLDVFFVKLQDHNYIVICNRSYVYGKIDHWNINQIYEVSTEKGNLLYKAIKASKFTSKGSGKTFYRWEN